MLYECKGAQSSEKRFKQYLGDGIAYELNICTSSIGMWVYMIDQINRR
jgi:hypothetical protein